MRMPAFSCSAEMPLPMVVSSKARSLLHGGARPRAASRGLRVDGHAVHDDGLVVLARAVVAEGGASAGLVTLRPANVLTGRAHRGAERERHVGRQRLARRQRVPQLP